ncbi:MAG: ABC transporter ATP-binding protein [Phycisphaerales bacterium]|nr:MAG: ABC transporter ATP-binding protein [Phycisphaerales bacterium]
MIDLATLRPQLRRYLRSSAWLARDGFSTDRGRVAGIIIANFIGIMTAASSMGVVLWYLKWAQDPSPITIRGRDVPLSTGAGSLLLVGVAALLIGLVSVLCIFYSELSVQRLSRNYQKVCMKRVLRMAGHPRLGQILLDAERGAGRPIVIRDLLNAGSRFSAFALRSIVQLFLPINTMVIAVIFLFIVNWLITVLVACLTAFYLVPMYLINRGVARQHRFYRATIPSISRGLQQSVRSLMQTSGPIRSAPELWEEALLSNEEFEQLQDALYGRILAARKVNFVNGVFLVVCVFALFVAFSLTAGEGGISWAALLAYIVALRFALRSLQQVAAAVTNVSRFFPEFEQFRAFVQAGEMADARSQVPPTTDHQPHLRLTSCGDAGPDLDSPCDGIELAPGSRILLVYPGAIDRLAMEQIGAGLFPRKRQAEAFLASAAFHDAPEPVITVDVIGNALGIARTAEDVDALRDGLSRLGVLDELNALPQGLDTPLTLNQLASLSLEARYAITAAYCFLQPRLHLFLNLDGLRKQDPQFQAAFLSELSGSCVFLVTSMPERWFRPPQKPVREQITHAAISMNREVLRCGSMEWLEQRLPQVEKLLADILGERAMAEDVTAEDDELDEF